MGKGTRYPHIVRLLKKYARPNGRVLELGCGGAVYRDLFGGRYVGIDLPSSPYSELRDISVYCSAEALPFKGETFDIVFLIAALYQIPDVRAVLNESFRVLCRGGRFLIFDYTWRTTRRLEKSEGNKRHVWTQWQLVKLVRKHGFKAHISSELVSEPEAIWKRALARTCIGKFLRIVRNEVKGGWNIIIASKL